MLILGCLGDPSPHREQPWNMGSEWNQGWYHNSAAALLDGEVIVAAVEEERFIRRKETGKFPFGAIEFCLSHVGVSLNDIDRIAFGEVGGPGEYRDPRISQDRIASVLRTRFTGDEDLISKIRLVEHHVGHAMSAYIPSGFERALVFTCDGFGDGISGMVALARDGRLVETLDTFTFANSLGRFYSSVLAYLGYRPGDEYRVMGLAPYGDPGVYRGFFENLYTLLPSGRFRIVSHDSREVCSRLKCLAPARSPGGQIERSHENVAAALQEAFEKIVFHVLSHWKNETKEKYLCLAGGTAQNSSFNGKLLLTEMFDQVYVQPAAHDAGIALGAAFQVYADESSARPPRCFSGGVYLGPSVPAQPELSSVVARWSKYIDAIPHADIAAIVGDLLASGQIVGWAQGRSEFGPRALGNRSILADPRRIENRERVNAIIKMRENFRPFAPAVKEERASEFFVMPRGVRSMPFMTFVVPVKEHVRALLGAVTHVDGTARIQTVARDENELFWRLLDAFEQRTGLPVLLNTSFNNSAEPMVQSVDDAIGCFLTTALDSLAVGEYLITKRPIEPAVWLNLIPRFRSDVMLTKFQGSTEDSGPIHAIAARNWHVQTISKALFQLLATSDNQPLGRHRGPEDQATILGRELHQLWCQHLLWLSPD